MKIILKDINNPKSNISDKRRGDVRISFIVSIIFMILFSSDFISIFNGSTSNLLESNLFSNEIFPYIFLIFIFISCLFSIIRFIFMELGKNCIYINDLVFSILVALLLILDTIFSIFSNSFNIFMFILTVIFTVILVINIIKENKK